MNQHYFRNLFSLFFIVFSISMTFGQGSTCTDIEPFCAGNQALIFPNCNDQDPDCRPLGEPGPDYGCLFQPRYPAWFYLQIDQPGRLDFRIIQNTAFDANGNPTGNGLDVDFIAWGPFSQDDDLCDYTLLQSNNEIACSYSAQPIENFTINNAQRGEIYVLVITNYERDPGFIKLEQTGGAGSTDCSILTTQTGCAGTEFELEAEEPGATNYLWEYDDGSGYVTIFNGNFPTITVTDAGEYRVTISFGAGTPIIKEYEIIVNPQPIIAEPALDLNKCDDGSGNGIFDLTQNNTLVRGAQPINFPITYYRTQLAAEVGGNPINPDNAYPIVGTSEIIWVRIEDPSGSCYALDSFEISYLTVTATEPTSPYYICDQDGNGEESINLPAVFTATILNGQDPLLYTVTYHDNPGDANTGDNALPQPYNVITSPITIYVRVENNENTDCFETTQFEIILDTPPVVNEAPDPLVACDSESNGFTPFFLHNADADITGGDPDLSVTYHYTLLDAQTNEGILSEPFENIIPYNDEVWARIEGPETSCYSTVKLDLQVRDSPELTEPTPYRICDDNNDGYAIFDLTTKEEEMLNGTDPGQYDLYYYKLEQDAIDAGAAALENPDFSGAFANITTYQNEVPNAQTIYVLAVGTSAYTTPNNGGEGCYDIVALELIVDLMPQGVEPEDYHLCDDTLNGSTPTDQISTFDLTSRDNEITGGDPSLQVTWFENLADETADTPIPDPTAYQNITNAQTIVGRVTNGFGCKDLITLTLVVDQVPIAVVPSTFYECDIDNDGITSFNLESKTEEIQGGNANLIVTYHQTLADAETGSNPLSSPYENTVPFNQTLFVRVAFASPPAGSGCYTIVELILVVNLTPDDSAPVSNYMICASDNSEVGTFNLDSKIPEILDDQTEPPFGVSFYLSQTDAENQTNAIVNTTAHQNRDAANNPINPQTIYVGIEDTETGCYIGGSQNFDLIVQEGAIAVAPAEPFVICDNLPPIDDGYAEFNLDDLTDPQVADLHMEILGGQDPTRYGITFHETLEQAETGTNSIGFPYVNLINPQRIYVRVTNSANQYDPKCYAVVDMIIKVEQLPEVVLDDQYRLCVDENGNPIPEEEGRISPPVIDTGLDPALFSFVWELDGVILIGETGASIIALESGEYTVTYTEFASDCQNSVSTTVIVSSPPFTYDANVVTSAFAGNSIIEATASGEGTYHFQLDDGPFQESGTFENVPPGTHLITIKDIYGCGSVTIEVSVINYPFFFTPNDDGYHDTWNIVGIGEFDPTAKIYIFDRTGKLLKQLSPMGAGWDGTYNGNPLPSSDYWFRVEYTEDGNPKEFKGHFTLKR